MTSYQKVRVLLQTAGHMEVCHLMAQPRPGFPAEEAMQRGALRLLAQT